MSALTVTAAVLWTFQPFNTIQDAHKFMDTLAPAASAQLSYGLVETDAEIAAKKKRWEEEERVRKARERDRKRCEAEKARKQRAGIQKTPSISENYILSDDCWTRYGYIDLISTIYTLQNRWVVSYQVSGTAKTLTSTAAP